METYDEDQLQDLWERAAEHLPPALLERIARLRPDGTPALLFSDQTRPRMSTSLNPDGAGSIHGSDSIGRSWSLP